MVDNQVFAQKLRAERTKRGWTQETAAERLGLSYRFYVALENNMKNPGLETLILVADYYHISLDYLLSHHHSYVDQYIDTVVEMMESMTDAQKQCVVDLTAAYDKHKNNH